MPTTPGNEVFEAAVRALEDDAGCEPERARALAEAVASATGEVALEVIAGRAPAFGSAIDRRVAALDRIVQKLDISARLPTMYEVGVIFRITTPQARNVLSTYRARFSEAYRARLQDVLKAAKPKKEQHGGVSVFVFDFNDPTVLDEAVERLRRRGLTRSLNVDKTKLQLTVDRSEQDRFGKSADEALKAR